MLILYIDDKGMKSLNVLTFTEQLLRRLGISKLYYWFNK